MTQITRRRPLVPAERSAARLAHQSGGLGVPSSNLGAPTKVFFNINPVFFRGLPNATARLQTVCRIVQQGFSFGGHVRCPGAKSLPPCRMEDCAAMIANELTARALDLCRRVGRPFPAELRAYASGWQRQGYDLPWCWTRVKVALREGRSLWQVEAEVHRHHARLQSDRDANDWEKASDRYCLLFRRPPWPRAGDHEANLRHLPANPSVVSFGAALRGGRR
jgi:hypothetical protein